MTIVRETDIVAREKASVDFVLNPNELFRLATQNDRGKLADTLPTSICDLIEIIRKLGFDPSRRVRRWKNVERIKTFLVEELLLRANRNHTFLAMNRKDCDRMWS